VTAAHGSRSVSTLKVDTRPGGERPSVSCPWLRPWNRRWSHTFLGNSSKAQALERAQEQESLPLQTDQIDGQFGRGEISWAHESVSRVGMLFTNAHSWNRLWAPGLSFLSPGRCQTKFGNKSSWERKRSPGIGALVLWSVLYSWRNDSMVSPMVSPTKVSVSCPSAA